MGWEGGLGTAILLEPLTASLVDFDQQVFDILDFALHRLSLVAQLAVLSLQAVQFFLQRIQLRPLTQPIPVGR